MHNTGACDITPEQLLGIQNANLKNTRAILNEKVSLDSRIAKKNQNPERRHLPSKEKKIANQHINDLWLRKNGDIDATNRLAQYRDHLRDDGWTSLDLVPDNPGPSNIMRLLYMERNGTIEWKVIQNH